MFLHQNKSIVVNIWIYRNRNVDFYNLVVLRRGTCYPIRHTCWITVMEKEDRGFCYLGMTENGDLSATSEQSVKVEWEVKCFRDLPREVGFELESPRFTFCNATWFISLYSNGKRNGSSGWIGVYLNKEPSQASLNISYRIGAKRPGGSLFGSFNSTRRFLKTKDDWGKAKFIQKSHLLFRNNVIGSDGILRIFCSACMEIGATDVLETPLQFSQKLNDYKRKIKVLKEKLSASKKEKEELAAAIQTQIQAANFGDLTLPENLKELYKSQYEGDTSLRVGDKYFLVHKVILAARSSVFRAMFEADTTEKNVSVVNIEDCEPGLFEDFLLFLYGGKFDSVKPTNALKLCLIADKYNVMQLKQACLKILSEEMSVESFCDTVLLASLYGEQELLSAATNFFMENADKVICTPKWISFLTEHATTANELLVKLINRPKI